jgi:hypothetical protein
MQKETIQRKCKFGSLMTFCSFSMQEWVANRIEVPSSK